MNTRRQARDERGSVAITGLLLTVALLMLLGVAVDIGHAFIVRRDLTAVADDAALAGSQQLDLNAWRAGRLALDPARAEQAADTALTETPDVSGAASASDASVHVSVRRTVPTILLRLVGISQLTIGASATAVPRTP
jgi:Flp pilus assembly protein TadG